ncbi:dihydropteroate synthase [Ornithinicoccus hortensis]|uniref:Dihydropteroate synthase n=1 Tax=Ornithinicoccus hortensis TaxID=82346 RepID=A0A542YVY1_9MICO|nr:dihydropteroate synthase [Ornithinicoccus hortensis]TQL52240.1 dihydropteroate synthase [Ornithinicoccus hortensis]
MTPADLPLVMGVVNVTPDSFSDGGMWLEPERAIEHGLELVAQGADLVDVGGESTRPGAERPPVEEELARVLPVVRALADRDVVVSVDTMRAEVAEQALAAGATMVNDVSGGLADPAMASLVARSGAPFVVMHWRAHSVRMDELASYDDVVTDVVAELGERVDALRAAGVAADQLIVDPGFGFSKDAGHNWQLLGGLEQVVAMGYRVLVGTSRKRFLGRLTDDTADPTPPVERDAATAATSVLAAQAGAWAVRVHDVPGTRDALAVLRRVRDAR